MAVAAQRRESKTQVIRDARLIFRNFSGRAKDYNNEGDRNFSVIIDPETARAMLAEGWRIKQLKPREEGEEGDFHLKVNVNYKTGRPPRCVMISASNPKGTELGADEVGTFDVVDIKKADLVINGSYSDMAGGGYSGYLKTAMITINEDELEMEYAQSPDAAGDPVAYTENVA